MLGGVIEGTNDSGGVEGDIPSGMADGVDGTGEREGDEEEGVIDGDGLDAIEGVGDEPAPRSREPSSRASTLLMSS